MGGKENFVENYGAVSTLNSSFPKVERKTDGFLNKPKTRTRTQTPPKKIKIGTNSDGSSPEKGTLFGVEKW